MTFWTKTQGEIEFLLFQKFGILCYDPSICQKSPKNGYFFGSLSWVFTFSKIQKKRVLVIIILIKIAKSDIFWQKMCIKIQFFVTFVKKKWFYRRPGQISRYYICPFSSFCIRQKSILPHKNCILGQFSPKKKKTFLFGEKNFFQFFWKKCCHFTLKMSSNRQQKFLGKKQNYPKHDTFAFRCPPKTFFWPLSNLGSIFDFPILPLQNDQKNTLKVNTFSYWNFFLHKMPWK